MATILKFYDKGIDKNTIEVVATDRHQFRLHGETVDVNYYDGFKPKPSKKAMFLTALQKFYLLFWLSIQ